MTNYIFSSEHDKEFAATLRKRVRSYFKETQQSPNANYVMVLKSISAIGLYLLPLALMLAGIITNIYLAIGLWAIMGLAKAFIGTSVMHDAVHGSYSGSQSVNSLMRLSTIIIGIDAKVWKIQHNVLHHTYTNIEDADEDIQPRFLFRFSPHQPRYWFHKYQHIYAIIIYGISTLLWVTLKDFLKYNQYRQKGLVESGAPFYKHMVAMFFKKSVYFAAFVVLPIMLLPFSAASVIGMFVLMHVVAGASLSLIFQPAHVVPTSLFIKQEEQKIDHNFYVHQLFTTCNFGMSNRFLSWFIGGLNFQIEHHLFPNVCHVHYPKLALIVQQTAQEFGLPYYANDTFTGAISNHFTMLRDLGSGKISAFAMAH